MNFWYVYMVRCRDGSLYTGITTNIFRRLGEHNSDREGARYTRSRRPVRLVYMEQGGTRSEASKREYALKKMTKKAKEQLIAAKPLTL